MDISPINSPWIPVNLPNTEETYNINNFLPCYGDTILISLETMKNTSSKGSINPSKPNVQEAAVFQEIILENNPLDNKS